MELLSPASLFLDQEARALLTRLERVKPSRSRCLGPGSGGFARAQTAVESTWPRPTALRTMVLELPPLAPRAGGQARRRRRRCRPLHFSRCVSMRCSRSSTSSPTRSCSAPSMTTACGSRGLDVVAADALRTARRYFEPPPVICYLDRGHGAAIRRARTRLPGGGENPVAIIRCRASGWSAAASPRRSSMKSATRRGACSTSSTRCVRSPGAAAQGRAGTMAWTIYDR